LVVDKLNISESVKRTVIGQQWKMTDTADKEVGRKQGTLVSRGQYDFSVHSKQLSQHALEAKHSKTVARLTSKESKP